jgi:hypothetical protein
MVSQIADRSCCGTALIIDGLSELTEEMIAEGLAHAEKVACALGDHRCLPLPHLLSDARASCAPKGRCKFGWIVANAGREAWDVWLDIHIGERRLCEQKD